MWKRRKREREWGGGAWGGEETKVVKRRPKKPKNQILRLKGKTEKLFNNQDPWPIMKKKKDIGLTMGIGGV